MADFSVNGALFPQSVEDLKKRLKDRYDASKNYPQLDGVMNIPADVAYALAEYIMQGKPVGDRQEIPIAISGWKRTTGAGKPYVSLSFKPHYRYEKAEGDEDKVAQKAAESLAAATDGNVLDDLF
ncbi:hypothetical protein [Nereida ignava]|jgi:hypothetical protein|uniref:hypothetical protein n=1 Tax=Nereida ignava TaxID=282199 RepID=UPI0030FC8165